MNNPSSLKTRAMRRIPTLIFIVGTELHNTEEIFIVEYGVQGCLYDNLERSFRNFGVALLLLLNHQNRVCDLFFLEHPSSKGNY